MTRVSVVLLVLVFSASQAAAGELVGTVRPADRVTAVSAAERDTEKKVKGEYDAATGAYTFKNLPAGTYDVILETKVGRIEGVNLGVESRLVGTLKPMTLKPGELDRDEIETLLTYLSKLYADRKKTPARADGVYAEFREGALSKVSLCRTGGDVATSGTEAGASKRTLLEVPLEADERPQVSDMLLGLTSLAKVRDALPRDFNFAVSVVKGKAGDIELTPVPPVLTEQDRKWLIDWVNGLKLFENRKRVLDMDGTGDHARVLVEKLRDQQEGLSLPVDEPTAFWRIERFEFVKRYGGWEKEKFTVVVREKVAIRVFRTYRWMFEKKLGGFRVAAEGRTTVPEYAVPDKLDPERGRVPF
jgi:hypothetical protein